MTGWCELIDYYVNYIRGNDKTIMRCFWYDLITKKRVTLILEVIMIEHGIEDYGKLQEYYEISILL